MKTGKLFAILFVFTFIIGTASFILFYKFNELFIVENLPVADNTAQLKIEPQTKSEIKETITVENETEKLDENYDWMETEESKFKIKLLEVGEGFHGDEVKAKTGETWLGLFKDADKYYLKMTKLKIKKVHDPIVDEKPFQKTGKSVKTIENKQPIFLIKNAKQLKQGKVQTVFDADNFEYEQINLNNNTDKSIVFNDVKYRLFVKSSKPDKSEYLDETSKLIFSDGKIEQVIYFPKICDDCGWGIYWAGDLDQDGKLDLYLNLSNHYNSSQNRLLLSSEANKNELLKEVARFTTVGC